VVESPFAGRGATDEERAADAAENLRYVRACLRDSILRGESPYASHALLTQPGVLDDSDPNERELGIRAGFAWRDSAELTAVYTDRGVSFGMEIGIDDATMRRRPVERRTIPGWGRDAHVDVARCVTCGWPLAVSRDQGCVDGDCSYRGAR